jgi:hypothetical protein
MSDVILSDRHSPLTRAEYAGRIGGEWRRCVLSIIEVGRLLNDAKQTLPRWTSIRSELVVEADADRFVCPLLISP